MGGRKGKTWPSFTIELELDGPGTGVEGGSGEGHEASGIRLVPSCGGIAGTVGVEGRSPTILGACGCGDGDFDGGGKPQVTSMRRGGESGGDPQVSAKRGGGESGNGAPSGGVLNRIVRVCSCRSDR